MFGRTRKRLLELEVALARAEATSKLVDERKQELEGQLARMTSEYSIRLSEGAAQNQRLIDAAQKARDELREEREKRSKAETDAAVYRERLDLLTNVFPAGVPPSGDVPDIERKYKTEEEEDLEHMFSVGMIDKHGLEAALEQAGLTNTEVELDFQPRDNPRIS